MREFRHENGHPTEIKRLQGCIKDFKSSHSQRPKIIVGSERSAGNEFLYLVEFTHLIRLFFF